MNSSLMQCECGQKIVVCDELSGYVSRVVFYADGQRVRYCPACGVGLRLGDLKETAEPAQ